MRVKYVFTQKSFDRIVEDHLVNRCYLPYNKVVYKKSFSESITLLTNFGIITGIMYTKNGKLNREDGPAIQHFNKQGIAYGEKYFLNGEELDEFQVIILNSKNENTISKN